MVRNDLARLNLICVVFVFFSGIRVWGQANPCLYNGSQIMKTSVFFQHLSYAKLLLSGSDNKADSIWSVANSREILECMVSDTMLEKRSRFFAAEILFTKSDWMPTGQMKADVALLYAEALLGNYAEKANPWGLPDDVGMIGEHVVLLGDEAIKAYYPLLSCKTSVQYYGSKAATAGKIYKYRVKDIAATYISSLLKKTFHAERAPIFRDLQITRLKKAVRKSGIIG